MIIDIFILYIIVHLQFNYQFNNALLFTTFYFDIMPKPKGSFQSEFEIIIDSDGKEKYKCKTCFGTWVKNTSRLKEHIEQCKDMDAEIRTL